MNTSRKTVSFNYSKMNEVWNDEMLRRWSAGEATPEELREEGFAEFADNEPVDDLTVVIDDEGEEVSEKEDIDAGD